MVHFYTADQENVVKRQYLFIYFLGSIHKSTPNMNGISVPLDFCRAAPQTSAILTQSSPTCLCPPPWATTPSAWPAVSKKQRGHSQDFPTGLRQGIPSCEYQRHLSTVSHPETTSSGLTFVLKAGTTRSLMSRRDLLRVKPWKSFLRWLVYWDGLMLQQHWPDNFFLPLAPKTN